ncbi:MAG: hypothetical protein WA087_03585 [Candidatus Saccharimonadales bacterium]
MEEQETTPEETIENETKTETTTKTPKKKHRLLRTLGIMSIICVIIIVSLGFIFPGLLWTKDLGVSYTKQDYDSFLKKAQYIKDSVPTGSSRDNYKYVYGKTSAVNTEFTSSELTAFANYNRPSYFAVKNVQIRINKDGTIEASGTVNVDYVLNEILGGKFSREQIVKEIPALGILPSNVNLYVNVGGSVISNSASLTLNSVAVQGIPIPDTYVKSSEGVSTVTNGINNLISKSKANTGSSIEKLAMENEKIVLQGKFPTSLTRQKK